MRGAIIGDIVGSPYEHTFYPVKTTEFPWFSAEARFTDDTVTTIAVAAALMAGKETHCGYAEQIKRQLVYWCRHYPDAGFGSMFKSWFFSDDPKPYGSFGNGAAMRVSPAAWVAESLDEAQTLAELTALVSHDHPEAVKSAVAVASAVYLARTGTKMEDIKAYIQRYFYSLPLSLAEIRPTYTFTSWAKDSVPEAMEAFFESHDFASAIANAVSLGGDADTQAAIAGAIAEAYYGVPDELWQQAAAYLPVPMSNMVQAFSERYMAQAARIQEGEGR